jgi:hypothetical protein
MSRRLVPEPELQKSLRSNYPQNFSGSLGFSNRRSNRPANTCRFCSWRRGPPLYGQAMLSKVAKHSSEDTSARFKMTVGIGPSLFLMTHQPAELPHRTRSH